MVQNNRLGPRAICKMEPWFPEPSWLIAQAVYAMENLTRENYSIWSKDINRLLLLLSVYDIFVWSVSQANWNNVVRVHPLPFTHIYFLRKVVSRGDLTGKSWLIQLSSNLNHRICRLNFFDILFHNEIVKIWSNETFSTGTNSSFLTERNMCNFPCQRLSEIIHQPN